MADDGAGVLVVGYGSELRRDDAVGRRVAEAVDRLGLAGVTVVTSTQLVPELVEPIAAAGRVVFVDASIDVAEATVRPLAASTGVDGSHHATPAELLGLVDAIGLPCPPAFLVEVPASDLSLGEGLSEHTATAVGRAVDEVVNLIGGPSGRGGSVASSPDVPVPNSVDSRSAER